MTETKKKIKLLSDEFIEKLLSDEKKEFEEIQQKAKRAKESLRKLSY